MITCLNRSLSILVVGIVLVSMPWGLTRASNGANPRLAPLFARQNKQDNQSGQSPSMTVSPRGIDYATFHAGAQGFRDSVLDSSGYLFAIGPAEPSTPVTAGAYDTTPNGGTDILVAKYGPSGLLVAATFLGGAGGDGYPSVAIGPDDNPVVATWTSSPDFPTTDGSTNTPGYHVAVSKLSADLTTLVWSTSLGGGYPQSAAADASGNIFVVGQGAADWPTTPRAYSIDPTTSGHYVCKLSAAGVLVASTFSGGAFQIDDVAVDSLGRPVAAGHSPDETDLSPDAYDTSIENEDVVVVIYAADLTARVRSTALGSTGNDTAFAVAVSPTNEVAVYGEPGSSSFPVSSGSFNTYWHANKDFLVKLDSTLTSLVWGAFPGGDETVVSYGKDVEFDAEGDVVFSGNTTGFTITPDAVDSTPSGGEGFVAIASNDGVTLKYATYLGSPGGETVNAIAVGAGGLIGVCGSLNGGGLWPAIGYGTRYIYSGFVTRFSITGPTPTCQFRFSAQTYATYEEAPGGSILFTVERVGPCTGAASVKYSTVANTATNGSDFTAVSGTLSFGAGVLTRTFAVPILDDGLDESTESFVVRLTAPSAGNPLGQYRAASVTIYDGDAPVTFDFSAPVYLISEPAGPITITVYRSGNTSGPTSVRYSTASTTATSGTDFPAIPATTLNFADGQTSATFQVSVTDDTLQEGVEVFDIILTSPAGRATLGKDSKALVHILDNEAP